MPAQKLIKKVIFCALQGALFLHVFYSQVLAAEVVINEVFANPVNEADEFIELYNTSDADVEITGFIVSDLANYTYVIPEATMSRKKFLCFGKNNYQYSFE